MGAFEWNFFLRRGVLGTWHFPFWLPGEACSYACSDGFGFFVGFFLGDGGEIGQRANGKRVAPLSFGGVLGLVSWTPSTTPRCLWKAKGVFSPWGVGMNERGRISERF